MGQQIYQRRESFVYCKLVRRLFQMTSQGVDGKGCHRTLGVIVISTSL
jgi:hypothetical protein